jgi:hypothetical protein
VIQLQEKPVVTLDFILQGFSTTWVFSVVGTFNLLMQKTVLGEATLVMFATIAVAGVNNLTTDAIICQKVLL